MVLDTFYYLFKADTSEVDKKLSETEQKIDHAGASAMKADERMARIGKTFVSLAERAGSLLGVGLSVGAAIHGINEAAAENFELEKLAGRFRTTAEAVDEFIDAADLLGISDSTAKDGLRALDAAVQDTAMGMGRAQKVFEDLGIKVKDAGGKIKPTTEVMAELQAKFKDMDKGKQIRVMERLGLDPALLKLFNADMGDLRERMEEIDRVTGFSLENAVKKSSDFTKASKEMWLEIKTLKLYLDKVYEGMNIAAMPFLTKAMNAARDALHSIFELIKKHAHFATGALIGLGTALSVVLLPNAISGAIGLFKLVSPMLAVGAAVAALAGAFALIYDDYNTWKDGGEAMLSWFYEMNSALRYVVVTVGLLTALMPRLALSVFAAGAKMAAGWLLALGPIGLAIAAVGAVAAAIAYINWDELVSAAGGAFDSVSAAFSAMGDNIVAVWDAIVSAIKEAISTITGAMQSVKSVFGFGSDTQQSVTAGKQAIATATQSGALSASPSPLAAATAGGAINKQSNKTTTVNVQKVEVKTQATDAAGISKAIGSTMQTQMRQAVSNWDDGVMA